MNPLRHPARVIVAAFATALAATMAAPAGATEPAPFSAFLAPDTSFAALGTTFVVQFRVGDPAEHFNGYRVKIRFDPARVAFRSVAEGSLMVAGAPSRFATPAITDSVVTYTHVLLGAGLVVNGPGELSRFTFEALSDGISALEVVSDPHCTFYDGGLCVNGDSTQAFPRAVTLEGAFAVTGAPPVGAPALGSAPTGLRFLPNPTGGEGELLFDVRRAGSARILLVDVAGRLVRETRFVATAGPARWRWNGSDATGAPVPAGVYFARLEDGAGARNTRIVLLR